MKQRVYLETTIVSYLTAHRSNDPILAAHQSLTREWWDHRRYSFDLVISELVLREASAGDPEAARRRMARLSEIVSVAISEESAVLAEALVGAGPIPAEYGEDALHIALCAVNGIDYLLTWNCKHLANAAHRYQIEEVVVYNGYECPIICTPEELLEE
jgi:predicted nucleic acid-binding protein